MVKLLPPWWCVVVVVSVSVFVSVTVTVSASVVEGALAPIPDPERTSAQTPTTRSPTSPPPFSSSVPLASASVSFASEAARLHGYSGGALELTRHHLAARAPTGRDDRAQAGGGVVWPVLEGVLHFPVNRSAPVILLAAPGDALPLEAVEERIPATDGERRRRRRRQGRQWQSGSARMVLDCNSSSSSSSSSKASRGDAAQRARERFSVDVFLPADNPGGLPFGRLGPLVVLRGCSGLGLSYAAGQLLRQTVVAIAPLTGPTYPRRGVQRSAVADLVIPERRAGHDNYDAPLVPAAVAGGEAQSAPAAKIIDGDTDGIAATSRRHRSAALVPRWTVVSEPQYAMRGQLLSYRALSNSYDGWTAGQMRAFVLDQMAFGLNQLECVAPDGQDSPHFHMAPDDAIVEMSHIAQDLDLNFSIWFPQNGLNFDEVVARCARLDSVFIPSGDPGNAPPAQFLAVAKDRANRISQLRPAHRSPVVWVSCQDFNASELRTFAALLEHSRPAWLAGVVYGPHTSLSLADVRALIPSSFRLRAYPDLGHGLKCGYPNERWSAPFAFTEAREVVNPRPQHFADVIRQSQAYTIGFSGYSDGCNDDVNKVLWNVLHWDPKMAVETVLREYGRYFWGFETSEASPSAVKADAALLLSHLEDNWITSPVSRAETAHTLSLWQGVERVAERRPRLLQDWRLQMHLYRAYYDAYQAARAQWEVEHVDDAVRDILQQYTNETLGGVMGALSRAQALLECFEASVDDALLAETGDLHCEDELAAVHPRWLTRMWQYAEALFNSISMELTVERYGAIGIGRAASMDTVHVPLSNVRWLSLRCTSLLKPEVSHAERIAGVREILNWTDPGPGGFYDNLGVFGSQPHLVPGPGPAKDPSFYHSALSSFMEPFNVSRVPVWPYSWYTWAETFYGTPLQLHYSNLVPSAQYRVRFVYGNGATGPRIVVRVDAMLPNGTSIEMQGYSTKPEPPAPIVLTVPSEAISSSGDLTIAWQSPAGGGNGRACQVSEVWLERL